VLADDPSLTARLPSGGHDPVRIILDSRASIPLNARVLTQQSEAPTVIASTSGAPADKVAALRQGGAEVLIVNEGSKVDLGELMKLLGGRGIASVLIEGGAGVHGSAFSAQIVDKVAWFIAPKIIGGQDAPGPVGGMGAENLSEAAGLERVKVQLLGPDILVEGYLKYARGG
jgi:diaminohydroxyphosphoribosylaminopyrimidine deaminase/5-amino-6-(5-phosphoribosylamino)uracil reductase